MPDKKPLRMRAACGQCHGAKVKCSGERTGCTRCAKLGLICEYGVSMVGRASKRKSTTNNDNDNDIDDDDKDMNDTSMTDQPDPTAAQQWAQTNGLNPQDSFIFASGTDPNLQLLPQDLLSITGLDDLSFHAFPDYMHLPGEARATAWTPGLEVPGSESSPSVNAPSGLSGDETTPGLTDLDSDTLSAYPGYASGIGSLIANDHTNTTSSNGTGNLPERAPKRPRQIPEGFPELPLSMSDDFERYDPVTSVDPIFVLAKITLYLENQLEDESLPLDRTLTIVRTSLKELMKLVGDGPVLVSVGCRALIFASVQNIVKLYSRSLRKHREGARGEPEATFKLGSFEIDPADQLKLQNQAIAAELGRCIRQIKKLSQEWSKVCTRGNQCKGVKHYHEMERHMEDMREDIETEQIKMIRQEFEKTSVHDMRLMHPLI